MGLGLLVAAFGCMAVLTTLTLRRVPIDLSKTLSQHIQQQRVTVWLGHVLLSVIGLLLAVWWWLRPLPLALDGLLLVMVVNCVVMGVLPYGVSKRQNLVHDLAAWGSVPVVLVFELAALGLPARVAWVALGALICQLALLAIRFVPSLSAWRPKLTLIGQLVFFAGFAAVLVAVELAHA